MRKIVVLILLIAGIVFVILGVDTYQESSANVDFLGIELSAEDKSGQRSAIIYFALGLISFVASYIVWKKR